jgi:putative membrane protein
MRHSVSISILAFGLSLAGCASNQSSPSEPTSEQHNVAEVDQPSLEPASRQMSPEETAAARGPSSTGGEPVTEPPITQQAPLEDSQIAAISDAANGGEVEQAKLAQMKAKNPRVKKFAQMMIQHHGQAKVDLEKLVKKLKLSLLENDVSTQLREESLAQITLLQGEKQNFDRIYIHAQVEAHQKVLELLDKTLIPSTKDPELLALLQKMRPKVEAHLAEAREIDKVFDADAGANRSGGTETSDRPEKQQPGTTPSDATRSGSKP